jgi:hypothetical protein
MRCGGAGGLCALRVAAREPAAQGRGTICAFAARLKPCPDTWMAGECGVAGRADLVPVCRTTLRKKREDVHQFIVETVAHGRACLAQVFQRELPDAAWLQPAVSGFFDYAVACAPTSLRMTSFEMAWLTTRETRALTLVWSMDAVWRCRRMWARVVSNPRGRQKREEWRNHRVVKIREGRVTSARTLQHD